MSSIPFFARRRLCSTFNAQEVGQLRAALQGAGVEFVIQQDRQNGSFFGIGLQLVPPSVEYIIYVLSLIHIWNLWADRESRSTFHASTSTGIWPTACTASV